MAALYLSRCPLDEACPGFPDLQVRSIGFDVLVTMVIRCFRSAPVRVDHFMQATPVPHRDSPQSRIRLSIYLSICIYMCTYIRRPTYMCIYIYMYAPTQINKLNTFMVKTCIHTYIFIYLFMYIHPFFACRNIYICMYMCIYIYISGPHKQATKCSKHLPTRPSGNDLEYFGFHV